MKSSSLLLTLVLAFAGLSLQAQTADDIHIKVDENPSVLRTVKPEAPQGESGLVAVQCVIDENGKVVSAVVSKSTNSALDSFALEAVAKWDFKPAKKDGKTVKTKVTIPFRFEGKA